MYVEGLGLYMAHAHEVLVSVIFSVLCIELLGEISLENEVCARKYLVIHRSKANPISKVNTHTCPKSYNGIQN